MNQLFIKIMGVYCRAALSMVVALTMVFSTFLTPTVIAFTSSSFGDTSGFSSGDFSSGSGFGDVSNTDTLSDSSSASGQTTTSSSAYTKCHLVASSNTVFVGGDVTLSWDTAGYDSLTINGQSISGDSGSKLFTNIQENTTYTLEGISSTGSKCITKVYINCLPPEEPKECELVIGKTVDKLTAVPGEKITYSITIKNVGEADCSGSGVLIEDKLDQNLTYISNTVTSNLAAGYLTTPVYTSSDHTLHFNGFVLTPGESGTINWVGQVKTPTQCGDFEVNNQAKATTAEFNNFQTWVYSQTVKTSVDNDCVVTNVPECTLTPVSQSISYGGTATFAWTTNHADTVTLTGFGTIGLNGSVTTGALFSDTSYILTAIGQDGQVTCHATVDVVEQVLNPTCDLFTATPENIVIGNSSKLTWATSNATNVFINNGIGAVTVDGSIDVSPLANITYILTAIGTNNKSVSCEVPIVVTAKPLPTCDSFTANPSGIMIGGSSTLTWATTNATAASMNNGIGAVLVDGTLVVSPVVNTIYVLTVTGQNGSVSCQVPVSVSPDPVPVCKLFTATPSQLPQAGGNVTLKWNIENASTATITPAIGAVSLFGSKIIPVTQSTTFTLTAADNNGDVVSCVAPVVVPTPSPFTCANNVSFTTSDNSITRGDNTKLNWSTTNVDSVSISGINATSLSGNVNVSPTSDITYVLTATKNNQSISCPLSIDVSSKGGGGGGSSSPRCELTISDKKIKKGEEIILRWDTTRATEVTLTDDRGKIIFTTDDLLSSKKDDYYDGSLKLKPTRDTEYTLLAERGSRDEECEVKVLVEDSITVLENRSQQPLVSSISLSQVPYTGFEAGPILTVLFYLLLVAWSLYITYLIVMRNRIVTESVQTSSTDTNPDSISLMKRAEKIRPEAFVQSTVTPPRTHSVVPNNLPTGMVQVGYGDDAKFEVRPQSQHVSDIIATELENRAHQQRALLSSDAIRYFLSSTNGELKRNEILDTVIADAKKHYPLEDGWIVINEARMINLCEVCLADNKTSNQAPYAPTVVPEGTGSLAEAIVSGNIIAAYEMIGKRPMFSLADAASDLDALIRARKGENVPVSDLLIKITSKFSEDQLKKMIAALTGAIDGTYNDEASAVKIAIMKAVKEVE